MQKPTLYQYVILFHPNEKEYEDGRRSETLTEIKTILANDATRAAWLAARDIPEELSENLDQVEVIVRPF